MVALQEVQDFRTINPDNPRIQHPDIALTQYAFARAIDLLNPNTPIEIESRKPTLRNGVLVYEHAPSLTEGFVTTFWDSVNGAMVERGISRAESPILEFNPGYRKSAVPFPDGEQGMNLNKIGEIMPGTPHVYTVARLDEPLDLTNLAAFASNLKHILGVEAQTLFMTYLPGGRQDKNVDTTRHEYNGNVINTMTYMQMLSAYFDRIFIVEPHSSAAQYHAATASRPAVVAPISPWKHMLECAIGEGLDIEGLRILGPDAGRNLVSLRIGEYLNTNPLTLDKTRISPDEVLHSQLPLEVLEQLKDGRFLIYDDEFNSGGTVGDILRLLEKAGAAEAFVFIVHAKLTGNFPDNLESNILRGIRFTDSRKPIGNLFDIANVEGKALIYKLKPWIDQIIAADMNDPGFNPWTNPQYSDSVIQLAA